MIVHLGAAAPMSLGMVWQTAWSLILGFTISAPLQTIVSTGEMRAAFGRGAKEIALAAAAGAASSSCSYWRMAAYLLVMPFATTAIAGAMVNAAVALLGLVPAPAHAARELMTHFALNYTFWRNLVFGALAVVPFVIDARRPMEPHPMHHDHDAHNGAHA